MVVLEGGAVFYARDTPVPGMTRHSQGDVMGVRYKAVKHGAGKGPGSAFRRDLGRGWVQVRLPSVELLLALTGGSAGAVWGGAGHT